MSWKVVSTCDLSNIPEAVNMLNNVGELIQVDSDKSSVMDVIKYCDAYMSDARTKVDKEFIDNAPKT